MKQHTTNKFFNQFVTVIRKDIKRVGIITDKDGTILLDSSLRETLRKFKQNHLGVKIYVIANSGRTVQDMINCLEEENIPTNYFDYIIGDNGGMCLDVKNNRLLYKHVMEKDIASKVLREFKTLGGRNKNIRLADGRSIYAYPSKDVKEYYKNSRDIVYKRDIRNLDEIDLTKITVTGSKRLIEKLDKRLRKKYQNYKTHIGKTSFPSEKDNNFRLDFTRNAYKRRCSKKNKRTIKIRNMYIFRK